MQPKNLLLCLALTLLAGPAFGEIRAYDVDPRFRQEVIEFLVKMERHTQLMPTGQILADLPQNEHSELEAVLEALAAKANEPIVSVQLRYWLVLIGDGAEDAAPAPDMLRGVVEELRQVHGDVPIGVLETVTLSSVPGQGGVLEAENIELVQQVYMNGDAINAQLVVETEYQELVVQVSLARGDFLVLSESSIEMENGQRGTSAIVVHWPAGR